MSTGCGSQEHDFQTGLGLGLDPLALNRLVGNLLRAHAERELSTGRILVSPHERSAEQKTTLGLFEVDDISQLGFRGLLPSLWGAEELVKASKSIQSAGGGIAPPSSALSVAWGGFGDISPRLARVAPSSDGFTIHPRCLSNRVEPSPRPLCYFQSVCLASLSSYKYKDALALF